MIFLDTWGGAITVSAVYLQVTAGDQVVVFLQVEF